MSLCTVDPYEYMQIKLNSDGTITRLLEFPCTPPTPDLDPNPDSKSHVLSKDYPLNPSHKTSLRIFMPKIGFETSKKLPIIVYFHGGGFVILQADTSFNHEFCEALASQIPAIVVSVDYRLAPEHRLPAAYDDALETVQWLSDAARTRKSEWLSKFGDFDSCFLMGTSAGGNIAYHAGIRVVDIVNGLEPVRVKGLILHQPFFGGSTRTGSEIRLVDHQFLPMSGSDLFWELGLPIGANRDHEFCNPNLSVSDGSGWLERWKELGWRVFVTDCDGDPLVDRVMELVSVLEETGVNVQGYFTEGGYHGLGLIGSDQRESLMLKVQEFVASSIDE